MLFDLHNRITPDIEQILPLRMTPSADGRFFRGFFIEKSMKVEFKRVIGQDASTAKHQEMVLASKYHELFIKVNGEIIQLTADQVKQLAAVMRGYEKTITPPPSPGI